MAVPKLRFKEFADNRYDRYTLTNITQNGIKNGIFNDPRKVGKGVPLINVVDLYNEPNIDDSELSLVDATDSELNKYRVEYGDIFFTRSSLKLDGIAHCNYYNGTTKDIVYDCHIMKITPNNNLVNSHYLRLLMISPASRKFFMKAAKTTTMTTIGQDDIKDMLLHLPSIDEQIKVERLFDLLETKIALQEKKIALLKDYKKGVFEKVFNSLKHYDSYKIEECFSHIGGTALEKYVQNNSKYKFISIGNYSIDGLYVDNGQRIELNKITATKLLDKHNLVMVLNDKTAKGDIIGSTILIDEDNKYIYNQRSERLVCSKIINPNFAWYILNSKYVKDEIVRKAQGGTQIYVNFSMVGNIQIKLPTVEVQIEISKALSKVDKKVTLELNKLKIMQNLKQALLQQMFI